MQQVDTLDQTARKVAKGYMGEFAWPTVVLGLALITAYVATPFLVLAGTLPLLAGVLIMSLLTYGSYTVMHDAAHGSIAGSHSSLRWLNELMGYLAGWVLMIPLTAHRHEHLAHHRSTNREGEDPDLVVADMNKSPWHAARSAVRVYLGQYRYYFRERWARAPRSQNVYFCLEVAAAIIPRIAFIAAGFWLEGLVLFLVSGIIGIALLMFLFAFIVHTPHESSGRYLDTSTIVVQGRIGTLVTVLWGWQNYHSIHHLFPRVPFYRYRDLFTEIEPVMVAKSAPIYRLSWHGLSSSAGSVAVAI